MTTITLKIPKTQKIEYEEIFNVLLKEYSIDELKSFSLNRKKQQYNIKRNYWKLEIESLDKEELDFLINDKKLEEKRKKLNNLITQKWI